ncbi:unnamed protein product [Ophioblennius macclurei]
MSRVFDEVMGLGDFADSSRGSATSCKSGGQDEAKGADKTSEEGEQQLGEEEEEEEDSSSSKQEEKQDERTEQSDFPCSGSPPASQRSSFNVASTEGGGGGSGSAAFDDAQDGLPRFGQEEEEEDWHFALPLGSLEDVDVSKADRKKGEAQPQTSGAPCEPCGSEAKATEEEEEEQEKDGSSGSANTSHSSRDHTPENSQDGAPLNQAEETEDSQQGETSEAAPMEDSNPPASPTPIIKEEPIDEGYDAALLPQNSAKQIKEELEQEEELKISSVYSVGGGSTFGPPTIPTPVGPTAIFIPGRGTVLQAMAPLAVRPTGPLTASLPTLTAAPPRPAPPPVPGSVRCSGCSKVLLKGQTAFQRKGSTQLFCSTVCLTGHLPPAAKNRICIQCNREILQPRDMVTVPGDDSNPMYFCGQFCLSVFRHKKKTTDKPTEKRPERKPEKPPEKPVERQPDKPFCTVCRSTKRIEHEVTHQGRLHKLCSNACFATWRMMRQLAMNCCEGCGLYCNSNSGSCQTLTIDKSQLNFCGPTCISTYRLTCKKMVECAYCHKMAVVSATIIERDSKGKIQLYCSSACVGQSRPPRHVLTDTPFPCCLCKVSAVPQYHLAMVDGTIRNFCSLACVTIYRKCGHKSQLELANGTSSLRDASARDASKAGSSAGVSPVSLIPQDYSSTGRHPSHTSVPPLVPPSTSAPGQVPSQPAKPADEPAADTSKVTCHHCGKHFSTKPHLFSHQGRISMFCGRLCSEQYKTQKNILAVCESCKQEKVHFETISYDQTDKVFCSDSCKVIFKHGHTSNQKDHPWRPCSYCGGISQKMLHSHYGGKLEEFCRPHCMSQYTVLYYGMGRCDSCRKQGQLMEKLQCLGSVRNFCNMSCLLHYCYFHFESSAISSSNGTGTAPQAPHAPTQPHHSSKMNPVIADVVSLANGSATQPCVSAHTALTGALPTSGVDGKNLDHASTQTDAMRLPASRRRQMKNKSVLCRPFTMDQESMCQLPTPSAEPGALVDSATQSDPPSTQPPAQLPKPQGEPQPCNGVPARLTGRHFLGRRETDFDCKVCSQHKRKRAADKEEHGKKVKREEEPEIKVKAEVKVEVEGEKGVPSGKEERKYKERAEEKNCEQHKGKQTSFYCKTCSGEPSLCPVPCFELYHTQLIYKTVLELEAQAS